MMAIFVPRCALQTGSGGNAVIRYVKKTLEDRMSGSQNSHTSHDILALIDHHVRLRQANQLGQDLFNVEVLHLVPLLGCLATHMGTIGSLFQRISLALLALARREIVADVGNEVVSNSRHHKLPRSSEPNALHTGVLVGACNGETWQRD